MSKIIDLSGKLTNERPKLKLAEDKVYEIDDRKNTILMMNQKMRSADIEDVEFIDEMIEMLLGEKAAKEINEMNLSISNYQSIMIAIMAAITGEEYEVAEKRFRQSADI
ncbi:hypothetical protein KQI42_15905 [Tissierella sp. MSJ-40]|uniref:Uncharacterized protein n=1 Tax=Tissierella simiarum TaxID=2841534 RepID=A0ABS6E995_9FIRM|nr:hypothetical protein [Tissierella simiarum]MBU5439500.1 hypothetical protein [Tissierella simiarum]